MKINPLDQIMGVQEASELWDMSADHIKALCSSGNLMSRKIGKTWVILKDQPNPRQRNKPLASS